MPEKDDLIYIDDLTGLFNRRWLYANLSEEIQQAIEGKYNLWLFMMDVDGFKAVNDTYGHLCGDEVLKEVALILKQNTKVDDKKIRYAGDEFTVILPRIEYKDVLVVAERIRAKIHAHQFKDKHSYRDVMVSTSIGIAGCPKDTTSPRELIDLADKALYVSKEKGKNCISIASEITSEVFWKKDFLERFPCRVFIGREREVDLFKELLILTRQANAKGLIISGELGTGKSRLLGEFESIALEQGIAGLSLRCSEKYITQSYYVIGQLLESFFSKQEKFPAGLWVDLTSEELNALADFLPSVKAAQNIISEESAGRLDSDKFNNALVKLILNASKIMPLCFMLDEAHFVDAQTLEVISRVSKKTKECRVLIIFAYELKELAEFKSEALPFLKLIKETRSDEFECLSLEGFNAEEIKAMTSGILLNFPINSEFINLISRQTEGNPLFVEELLKFLIDKEYIFYKDGHWQQKKINPQELPSGLEGVIRARISGLDQETREMIAKAAAIGEDFQLDLLQKIDSEDKGYVMDLIETAKKIGLIYEKDVDGKGNFSFITNKMRKVLLDALGEDRTKHLYSRLGNIKEELNSGKLDAIAGELYYNFKKAEENERAQAYAKAAQEGRGLFYDRSIRYAQTLLKEARDQKAVIVLSKNVLAQIPEIIRHIYIAAMNYNLYPPQNEMRTSFIRELHKRLIVILKETEALIIAAVGTDIVVNNVKIGKELTAFFEDAYLKFLKSIGAHSITFLRGLKEEELNIFIEVTSAPDKMSKPLAVLLGEAGVSSIQADEVVYDVSKKRSRERESLEEIMLVDYLLGRFSGPESGGGAKELGAGVAGHTEEIMQTLEKMGEEASLKTGRSKEDSKAEIITKSVEKIGKELKNKGLAEKAQYKENLAKTIFNMEPDLRAKLLTSNPQDSEGVDILQELAGRISDETIIEVLTKQYQQYEKNNIKIEEMQRLLERFLPSADKKSELAPKLKEAFINLGASQEECAWMFGEKAVNLLSLDEKVNFILTVSAQDLKTILPLLNFGELFTELWDQGKEDAALRIEERIFDILDKGEFLGQSLIEAIEEMLKVISVKAPVDSVNKFAQRLLALLKDKEFYSCFLRIVNSRLDAMVEIFLRADMLGIIKELAMVYVNSPERLAESVSVLDLTCGRLTQDLIRRIEANLDWKELSDILILLKDYSLRHLIEKILFEEGVPEGKYFEAYMRRRIIGNILNQMPTEAVSLHLKEKILDARHGKEYIVKNLVEAIGSIEDEEVINVLEPLIKYPNISLRGKIIFNLSKRQGEKSAFLLGEALSDENESIRNNALQYLKNRKDGFALVVLKKRNLLNIA